MDQTVNRAAGVRTSAIKKPRNLPLVWVLVAFFALFFLRDVGGVGIPRIIYTALAAFSFVFLKENEDFALLFAIIPCSTRINFNEITLAFFVIYFLRRLNRKLPNTFLLMLGVLFIELFNVLTSSGDFMIYIRFAVLFLIGVLLVCSQLTKENILAIAQSYVISAFLICVDVYVITFSRITMDQFFTWGYRFGRVTSFVQGSASSLSNFDPNELAVFILVGFFLLAMLWYIRRVPLWLFLSMGAVMIYCYALTQSRGGLFSLIAFIAIFWLCSMRNFKDAFAYTLFVLATLIVFIFLAEGPLSDVYDRFVYRFSVDDVTSGRFDIWELILDKQIAEPFRFAFGFGTRGYNQLTGDSAAHNTLLDIYASWGVVGTFLVFFWHVGAVRSQIRTFCENVQVSGETAGKLTPKKKIPLIYYAPFIAVLVSAMSLQFYMVTVLSLMISLSQVAIRLAEFDEDRKYSYAELKKLRREEKTSAKLEAEGGGKLK